MPAKLTLTKKAEDEIEAALSDGMTISECCDLVGIGRSTFYSWVRRGTAGEKPFAAFVLRLRRSRAEGTRTLLGLARLQAMEDPGQVRYLLGIRNPRAYGREPEPTDLVQEALDEPDRDDQVAMMANHPDVRTAVLASITDDERAALDAPRMLTQGDGDDR